MNNQVIITQTLSKNQVKNLISKNDNPKTSFNRLKHYIEQDAIYAAMFLNYKKTDLIFIWIDAEPATDNGVTVDCEDKTHQAELTTDLIDAKTRIIASLDWAVPREHCAA